MRADVVGGPLIGERPPHRPLVPDVGVIALVPDRWTDCWQTRHYVLTRLARYFHVAWCNPAPGDPGAWRRQDSAGAGPSDFTVHDPPRWARPVNRVAALGRLMVRAGVRGARRTLKRRGAETVLLSLWRPSLAAALDAVPHQVSCYHIDDEYTFSEVERPLDAREAALIRRVDQIFVTSPALHDKKGHLNPHTLVIPNGVDYAAYVRSWPEPADLASIPHPRIGYVGVVKKQLDLELVYALARRHRSWSFVLVGPSRHHAHIGAVLDRLADLPYVHFLGEKPVGALPSYTQHMDACMLCYKVDDYTKFIYPLKLHESLASGLPCVGAPIRTLQEFADVVDRAGPVEEWSAALTATLSPAAHSDARRTARRAVARRHDWDRLVHLMALAMAERLGPRYRQRVQEAPPAAHPLPLEA
jgi:glycosyltransferase involved in cell wall biosynthesis